MDIRKCDFCGDNFIFSHITYSPLFRFVDEKKEVYCSEPCYDGIDPKTPTACGCDVRKFKHSMKWRADKPETHKWYCFPHYGFLDSNFKEIGQIEKKVSHQPQRIKEKGVGSIQQMGQAEGNG